jgi:hypothetical protein
VVTVDISSWWVVKIVSAVVLVVGMVLLQVEAVVVLQVVVLMALRLRGCIKCYL